MMGYREDRHKLVKRIAKAIVKDKQLDGVKVTKVEDGMISLDTKRGSFILILQED